jgi:PAS domain S-box-containing protein
LQHTDDLLKDELAWRRLLIEESRDPIVVLDEDAGVVDANWRFAEMLGYTKEEVSHLHVWDWDAEYTEAQIREMVDVVNATGDHFETKHRRKDGTVIDVELSNNGATYRGQKLIFCICRDISEKKRAEQEREELIKSLRESLAEIRTLRGILPLCSYCKKIRDDEGYWEQVDTYIKKHSEAAVTHGICPECMKAQFPDAYKSLFPDSK